MKKNFLIATLLFSNLALSSSALADCALYGVMMSTPDANPGTLINSKNQSPSYRKRIEELATVSAHFAKSLTEKAALKGYRFSLQNSEFLKSASKLPSGAYVRAFNAQLVLKSTTTDDLFLFVPSEPDMHELVDGLSKGIVKKEAFISDDELKKQTAYVNIEVNFCSRGYDCDDSNKKVNRKTMVSGNELVNLKKQIVRNLEEKIKRHEFKSEFDDVWEQVLYLMAPGTIDRTKFETAVIDSFDSLPACR